MDYKLYTLKNYKQIPQINNLPEELIFNIDVVGTVLPFKTNNYVVDELIDWDNYESDPMFILTFPQKGMLKPEHFDEMASLIKSGADQETVKNTADRIRLELNPHPAGQLEHNVPEVEGEKLMGIQHKYQETMLFFPQAGQTCHAYCTFCFRWPQFTGMDNFKFAMKQADEMISYLKDHPEITDILFTGGDPMVMSAKKFRVYVDAILKANLPHIKTIRIGSKTLSFWPYRYLTDKDSEEMLSLFKEISEHGIHLSLMAHINHHAELSTPAFAEAVKKIRNTGANIRTQSPLLMHINAEAGIWAEMWKKQVNLGLVPYYMFMARNTGAQHYFAVPMEKAYHIFQEAYSQVSGVARTVRGPSMSAGPGKVMVDGITEIGGKKQFLLSFIQGRNPEWVKKPFFAEFDENAIWLDDLKPAFGEEKFFFE